MSNNLNEPVRLDIAQLRRQAKAQLKLLRVGNPDSAMEVARRLATLRSFSRFQPEEIIARADRVQLKHLLALAAEDNGFESWPDLVRQSAARQADASPLDNPEFMYVSGMDALINRWFSSYEEALQSLAELGGYLLPYRNQFFITERAGVVLLGLDAEDPDWEAIGWNWVRPENVQARLRLAEKRIAAKQASGQS